MKNLLTIVTQVCDELGVAAPSSLVGSTDNTAKQFLALAKREGDELYKRSIRNGGWPVLRKQFLFNITSVGPYTGTITPNSLVLTGMSSVTGIQIGWIASSTGLLNDSIVTAVDPIGMTVTINELPSATSILSGQQIFFGQELYNMPSDLGYFINQTGWDRNFRWQLLGPLDAQEWQVIKSGISPVGPRMRFRVMGGKIALNPVPSSTNNTADLIVFEYYSNSWCTSSGGAAQTTWQADTDLPVLVDELFILGIKWRYLRSKGLSYDEEQEMYEAACDREAARAGMARSLPLNARASGIRLLSSQNVPDTNFGA